MDIERQNKFFIQLLADRDIAMKTAKAPRELNQSPERADKEAYDDIKLNVLTRLRKDLHIGKPQLADGLLAKKKNPRTDTRESANIKRVHEI